MPPPRFRKFILLSHLFFFCSPCALFVLEVQGGEFLLIFAAKSIVEGSGAGDIVKFYEPQIPREFLGSARRGAICAKRGSAPFKIVFSVMFLY